MKIIFFGSSEFAVPSLEAVIQSGHIISCVITQPDRRQGRGLQVEATPIKKVARHHGLTVMQPVDINDPKSVAALSAYKADCLVVIAYGQILSQAVLDIPGLMAINLHASLLPRYRGAAPVNWAIINGDRQAGVTVIKIIRKMDAGPIIRQRQLDIAGDDTAITLTEKLAGIGSLVLLEVLAQIENKTFELKFQDEGQVSLAHKLRKDDGRITWDMPAVSIYNRVRGVQPWPGAFTHFRGKLLKLLAVSAQESACAPAACGQVVEVGKKWIGVATGKGILFISELQIEGKRPMSAQAFIAGHDIKVGDILY